MVMLLIFELMSSLLLLIHGWVQQFSLCMQEMKLIPTGEIFLLFCRQIQHPPAIVSLYPFLIRYFVVDTNNAPKQVSIYHHF